MSDIGFPGLDELVLAFIYLCFIGPPVIVGLVFLGIGIFVRNKKVLLRSYFAGSIIISASVLIWLGNWQNMPALIIGAFPISAATTTLSFGVFLLLRQALRRVFSKKLAIETHK